MAADKYNIWTAYLKKVHWRGHCCLCHVTWVGLDQNSAEVSMNLLQFVGLYNCFVFSHLQNGDFDAVCGSRLTCPPHPPIHWSDKDEQAVWENDTNTQRCWSTSHQLVSVPDESDWIILGDERKAPAGRETQACKDLASFNSRKRMKTNQIKANWSLQFIWFG